MKSRIHFAIGAVILMAMSTAAGAAPEQAPAGAVADRAHGNAVVATVLDQRIMESELQPPSFMIKSWQAQGQSVESMSTLYRGQVLATFVWRTLSARFVQENDIKPTEAELKTFQELFTASIEKNPELTKMQEKRGEELRALQAEADSPDTPPARREELKVELERRRAEMEFWSPDQMARRAAELLLPGWKMQQALYKKYGGRVGWQQFGTEAPDAVHALLQERATRGDFSFANERDAALFWSNFPGPEDPISFEVDNPAQVFESIESYFKLQAGEE